MEAVFKSFCSFGADKGGAAPLMDGSKLVKLCRDQQLFDKNITQTDVDIIFSKVKPKNERKINFKQFEDALKMIAEKKFPGTEDSLEKLKAKILEGGGPVAHKVTKTLKTGAVERLSESQRTAAAAASGGGAASAAAAAASPAKDSKEPSKRKGSATRKPHSATPPTANESSLRGRTPVRVKTDPGSPKTAAAEHDKTTPDPEPAENGAKDTPSPGPAEPEPDQPPSGADDAKAVAGEKEELVKTSGVGDLLDFTEEQNAPHA